MTDLSAQGQNLPNGIRIERRRVCAEVGAGIHPHPVAARVLAARGVKQAAQVTYPLAQLARPDGLAQMPRALELLGQALREQWRIAVVGDYDADGATSTALLVSVLRHLGAEVFYLIPSRFSQGYGLSPAVAEQAAEGGARLLVTVDNGVSSFAGVARAQALGLQVLITDHHLPAETLPPAEALVNPNVDSEAFPSRALAGVGVVFYLCCALVSQLKREGAPQALSGCLPHMPDYLDLVALGTVADVVPLDDNNRILVAQGLKRMRAGKARVGIEALLQVAKRDIPRLGAEDLGFYLGPRLNAAGRLDDMSLGVELLLCQDFERAMHMAEALDDLNQARRSLEQQMREQAEAMAAHWQATGQLPAGLCLHEADWHEGIVGIVAGRLKDRYRRPVIALALGEDGFLKGSARAVPGVHLRDLLVDFDRIYPGVLRSFGGHAMAAGLSLAPEHLETLQQGFAQLVQAHIGAHGVDEVILSDGPLDHSEMCLETVDVLRALEPWGQGFPAPVFDGVFQIVQQRWLKGAHLKLRLITQQDAQPLDAIWFNASTMPKEGDWVHCAYRLADNHFRGQVSVQLMLQHCAPIEQNHHAGSC